MAKLVVASRNMRLYYSALKYFGKVGSVEGIWPVKTLDPNVRVVLTTPEEAEEVKKTYWDKMIILPHPDLEKVSEKLRTQIILKLKQDKKHVYQVLIGIDPGEITGISLQADGMILVAEELEIEEVPRRIFQLLKVFPAIKTLIKVGDNPNYGQRLILKLINGLMDFSRQTGVSLHLIDEAETTKKRWNTVDHKTAATKIAQREGKELSSLEDFQKKLPEISRGRLKEIQNWSRQQSKSITISAHLASSVAKGEISLREAIDRQKEKKNEK
ncbi:MAG: hypothetical protein ACFFCZ_08930 [Promethearchaeota archaeon]